MDITEEYEDVLHNLETPVAQIFRNHPQLLDSEVKRAFEAVLEHYRAESAGRTPKNKHLSEREQQVADSVLHVCEWRLGRTETNTRRVSKLRHKLQFFREKWSKPGMRQSGQYDTPLPEDLRKTPDEMQKCIKRIIKSIDRWGRVGGRQGYLNFISPFIK